MSDEPEDAQQEHLRSLPEWLRVRFSDTQRYFIIWVIVGLSCGLAAVAFHEAITLIFDFTQGLAGNLDGAAHYGFLILAPTVGGLIGGIIICTVSPEAVGSGIPQTKARYYREFGIFRLREAIWRFIAGAITVGSGISLGREGPTVHICSAIASKIGQVFGLAKKRVQAMTPVGMGAGIAAAFNTPMAAMFFVFEELLGDFSSKALFGILVAVVIAAIVERTILGENPLFNLDLPAFETSAWMLLCIPLAVLSALLGVLFIRQLLWLRLRLKDSKGIPRWLRPALGGLVVGLTGVLVLDLTGRNGVFGIGYGDLSEALNGQMLALGALVGLLVGKYIATIAAYACGASGGLFAPTLFLGGILGALVGVAGRMCFNYEAEVVGAMAMLGMGAFFASVIRCPLTSFMIIFELTRNYTIMLPLMAGNILAYTLSSRWNPVGLYDSLLLQDRITLKKMPAYLGEQDWRNLPIQTIMTFDVATVAAERTARESLQLLRDRSIKHHAYPVIEDGKRLIGIITNHELEEHARDNCEATVKELLPQRALVRLSPETSIREAARVLVVGDVMQAPVVAPTEPDRLLGIVTLHDIARQQNAITESLGR